MADSGFTGRSGRRTLLKAAALAPMGALLCPKAGSPADYASAGEALAAIDALEGEVRGACAPSKRGCRRPAPSRPA